MAKKVKLDKRWKEVLFALTGFGPNLLMTLMMAYFTDAVNPIGLEKNLAFQSYNSGVIIVSLVIFPILWTIGRIFDGFIDVPLAAFTDNLKNKTGKRWISIVIAVVPMIVSFILCWIPVFGTAGVETLDVNGIVHPYVGLGRSIGNSIWIFFWSIVFFASYTLALITFYGALSDVCEDQTQRARVSAYKSVFDTIQYAFVYALVLVILQGLNIPVWKLAIYASPLMLTILIPLFMQTGEPDKVVVEKNTSVPIGTSIALTVKSKPFVKWEIVNCISFFGLQMFLVAQNTLISGVMGLEPWWCTTILNTAAFAPVPLMLFLFNKLRKKSGIRIAFQSALLSFGLCILSFCLGGKYIWGDNLLPKLIIGVIGGVIGSWGIGAFFMVPYLIPTAIASVEEEITGKNHSAMYFAVQALATSAVGAISSSLIYNYIKNWTAPGNVNSQGVDVGWKCGVSLVPLIVAVACIVGFFACFFMPKRYTPGMIYADIKASSEKSIRALNRDKERVMAKAQAKIDEIKATAVPEAQKKVLIEEIEEKRDLRVAKIALSIANYQKNLDYKFNAEKSIGNEENRIIDKTSVFADCALWVLTGGIYGIVHVIVSMSNMRLLGKELSAYEKAIVILSLFIPFLNIWSEKIFAEKFEVLGKENKVEVKPMKKLVMITSIFLPLFTNVIALAVRANNFNKISDKLAGK